MTPFIHFYFTWRSRLRNMRSNIHVYGTKLYWQTLYYKHFILFLYSLKGLHFRCRKGNLITAISGSALFRSVIISGMKRALWWIAILRFLKSWRKQAFIHCLKKWQSTFLGRTCVVVPTVSLAFHAFQISIKRLMHLQDTRSAQSSLDGSCHFFIILHRKPTLVLQLPPFHLPHFIQILHIFRHPVILFWLFDERSYHEYNAESVHK